MLYNIKQLKMDKVANNVELNTYLSNKLIDIGLNDYFRLVHSRFYSSVLDDLFMYYYLTLIHKSKEFVVDHTKLQEYGILNNINEILDNSPCLIKNKDYKIYNTNNQYGNNNIYKLTPHAFKICLINSNNSKKYADYYILLEDIFKNYQKYLIMYQSALLLNKNNEIDELINKNKKYSFLINGGSSEINDFTSIDEFNTCLSNKSIYLKLEDYFSHIQIKYYPDLDISFMNYYLTLINNEENFIVEHIKLQEYGIINNSDDNIRQILDNTKLFVKNKDYLVDNNEYKLTPKAFKICLIHSKNSKKYSKYYILLEHIFKKYQEYLIMYQTVLLHNKDNQINNLTKENEEKLNQIDNMINTLTWKCKILTWKCKILNKILNWFS